MSIKLTDEQQVFISYADEFNERGLTTPNLFVEARAGSAKTTTMVEFAKELTPSTRILCVAFNSDIAKELKERMPPTADCRTMNSLGYHAWAKAIGKSLKLEKWKSSKIFGERLNIPFKDRNTFSKLMGICKANGVIPRNCRGVVFKGATIATQDVLENLAIDIGLDFPEQYKYDGKLEEIMDKALTLSIQWANDGIVDFDDQLYMPAIFGAPFKDFDVVMVDEAQDVSPIQIRLLSLITTNPFGKRKSMFVAVGDRYQAIYGFRGADHDAVDNIIEAWECEVITLTTCFRCKEAIIQHANKYVADINAFNEGGTIAPFQKWNLEDVQPGDAVLCRNNAPLVVNALRFLAARRPAYIIGKEIGKGLINMIEKCATDNPLVLPDRLHQLIEKERAALLAKGRTGSVAILEDKVACILAVLNGLEVQTVDGLKQAIDSLFAKTTSAEAVNFSTIHKAKGQEWEHVFILDSFLMPSRHAKTESALQQEYNMIYVAITRAKDYLGYITTDGFEG